MKPKNLLNVFAAFILMASTAALTTACSNEDNPTIPLEDVNKGIVINLDSIVIKPYLQMGASLANVEAYMQKNYADWTYRGNYQKGESLLIVGYIKGNQNITYAFGTTPAYSLYMSSYGFDNSEMPFPVIKAELERNGFIYKGKLNFEIPDASNIYHMFVSADGSIEAQFVLWGEGNRWSIGFQPLDENDLNYLEPVN